MQIKCLKCWKTFNSLEEYFDINKHECSGLLTKDVLQALWNKYGNVRKICDATGYSYGYVNNLLLKYGIKPSKEHKWKLFKVKINKAGKKYPQVISIPFEVIQKAFGGDFPNVFVYRTYVEEEGSKKIIVEVSEDLSKYNGSKEIKVDK